jgi:hypothetical protein
MLPVIIVPSAQPATRANAYAITARAADDARDDGEMHTRTHWNAAGRP